jgi:beta-glucosidase
MESPISVGFSPEDCDNGGNGYVPVSLQYRPYTSIYGRSESIAGGDPLEDFRNRSYQGKTNTTANEEDLDNVIEMKKLMKDKPVIVSISMKNPTVMEEFEPYTDAILVNYGVQTQAVFDVMTGAAMPSGLLPMQLPKDMETVEKQKEDVPFDMDCYKDSEGNTYDFAFGLSFNGVIVDARTQNYKH